MKSGKFLYRPILYRPAPILSICAFLLMLTGKGWLAGNGDGAVRLMKALGKAEAWAAGRPDETMSFMETTFGYTPKYAAYAYPNRDLSITLPQKLLIEMEYQARRKSGGITATGRDIPDYLEFFTLEPLKAAGSEAVSIIH